MKALLIGFTTEKTFRHTVEHACSMGSSFEVLDLALLREDCRTLRIVESADDLIVELDDSVFRFSSYSAFYNRAYWTDLEPRLRGMALSRLVRAIAAWLVRCNGMVVNRPGCGTSNCNKFVHGLALQRIGFTTPETYLVGDPIEAGFLAQNGLDLVSKSCSSAKTRTVAMDAGLWSRVDTLVHCPTLFQRRVYGDEVRAHWVDGQIFAERIKSKRVDYRFAEPSVAPNVHRMCDLPEDIAELCHEYCRSQALMFAGFDFKVTRDEQWVILEANPMPGYESYDRRQGNRIAQALVTLLLSGKDAPAVPRPDPGEYAWAKGKFVDRAIAGDGTLDEIPTYEVEIPDLSNGSGEPLFVTSERRPATAPFYYAKPKPRVIEEMVPAE